MLKGVPDTNILVSALINPDGNSAKIGARVSEFVSCTSEAILKEVVRVLHYDRIYEKYDLTEALISQYIQKLRKSQLVVAGAYEIHGVVPDPDDEMIIACALEAGADYIISGDPHLLNLKHYRNIQIVTPKAFREILDQAKASN
jgi:putative PIN family toxin of toxin-antitoxin system